MIHKKVSQGQIPISVDDVKRRIGVGSDETTRDSSIQEKIMAAMAMIEGYTGTVLAQCSIVSATSCWDGIRLINPLFSVQSLSYVNDDGNSIVIDPSMYYVDDFYGRIVIKPSFIKPNLGLRPNAIRANYISGYAVIPPDLIEAIHMTVGHWEVFQTSIQGDMQARPTGLPTAAKAILTPYVDTRERFQWN